MVPLFKSLVRSTLEYANVVWCPYTRKSIDLIESVQRHFTKHIIDMKDMDYSERLKVLNLPSLEYRRFRGDLIEMYKICHNKYDPVTTRDLFDFVPEDNITRNNGFKVSKKRTNHNQFKYFFTNRIINPWNNLPSEVVNTNSLNSFKNHIDTIFSEYKYSTNFNLYYL